MHTEFSNRIDAYLQHSGRSPESLKILDWGCGRGADVLSLRERGIEAFGVDIAPTAIDKGRPAFAEKGLDASAMLSQIGVNNNTQFPDSSFDIITSYEVIEHVQYLESAAKEMFRLLKPGGFAVLLYPGHLTPVEAHLFMPIVHWLPKNGLRRRAIWLFTALNIEPHWPDAGEGLKAKSDFYYHYSINNTYYRSPREVMSIFAGAGFMPVMESNKHARIKRAGLDKVVPAPLLNWALSTFVGCVLVVHKPPA